MFLQRSTLSKQKSKAKFDAIKPRKTHALANLELWQNSNAHSNEANFETKNRSNSGDFFDFFEKRDIIELVFRSERGEQDEKAH